MWKNLSAQGGRNHPYNEVVFFLLIILNNNTNTVVIRLKKEKFLQFSKKLKGKNNEE